MENENPTPMSPVVEPVVAPVVAPEVKPVVSSEATQIATPVLAEAVVSTGEKRHSHKTLYVLLTVFLVMGGALVAVGILKPDLVTSTIAWVTNKPMHAASSESRVLVNGEWVESSNPEAELGNVKKPSAPVAEENVAEEPVDMPANPDEPVAPEASASEPAMEPEMEAVPSDGVEASADGAFDLGVAQEEPAPVAPEAMEPEAETPTL